MYGKGFPDNRSKAQVEEDTHGGAPRTKRPRGIEAFRDRFPHAVELWVLETDKKSINKFTLHGFAVNGRLVILQQFNDHRAGSWDVYVAASDAPEISKTLDAVEAWVSR